MDLIICFLVSGECEAVFTIFTFLLLAVLVSRLGREATDYFGGRLIDKQSRELPRKFLLLS